MREIIHTFAQREERDVGGTCPSHDYLRVGDDDDDDDTEGGAMVAAEALDRELVIFYLRVYKRLRTKEANWSNGRRQNMAVKLHPQSTKRVPKY